MRAGILERAAELGYRVEDFWLRGPGMSAGRIRDIFYNRVIEGVICIGAPTLRVELPPELIDFTVVTAGLSISSPVHRVRAHSSSGVTWLLEELKERSYERTGAFLSTEYDSRSGHLPSAMYLYQVRHLFDASDIPILYAGDTIDGGEFITWFRTHRPDVIILSAYGYFEAAQQCLKLVGMEVPRDVGFASRGIQFPVEGRGLSGV